MVEKPLPANPARTGGLLLAGGLSLRFGTEKAVARFRNGLMMDAVAARLGAFPHFAVSARRESAAAKRARAMGAEILHDDPAAPSGPLAGVLAGLTWAQERNLDFLATAPCDAPVLPLDLFARLLSEIGAAPAAFAVTARGEHPLCALWAIGLRAPLDRALATGFHPSVRSFLAAHGAVGVRFDDMAAFANANTANALAALERSA